MMPTDELLVAPERPAKIGSGIERCEQITAPVFFFPLPRGRRSPAENLEAKNAPRLPDTGSQRTDSGTWRETSQVILSDLSLGKHPRSENPWPSPSAGKSLARAAA